MATWSDVELLTSEDTSTVRCLGSVSREEGGSGLYQVDTLVKISTANEVTSHNHFNTNCVPLVKPILIKQWSMTGWTCSLSLSRRCSRIPASSPPVVQTGASLLLTRQSSCLTRVIRPSCCCFTLVCIIDFMLTPPSACSHCLPSDRCTCTLHQCWQLMQLSPSSPLQLRRNCFTTLHMSDSFSYFTDDSDSHGLSKGEGSVRNTKGSPAKREIICFHDNFIHT